MMLMRFMFCCGVLACVVNVSLQSIDAKPTGSGGDCTSQYNSAVWLCSVTETGWSGYIECMNEAAWDYDVCTIFSGNDGGGGLLP